MPRKPSTIAPAVRIRENQRRARVRRKELVDELKSRVRDYELQGAMATTEMQEAARKVALENKRLRALLAEKGVPTVEVEAYLRGHDCDASFTASLPTPESADMVDTQSQTAPSEDPQQPSEMFASVATNQSVSAVSPPSTPVDIGLESVSQAGKNTQRARSSHETELFQPGEQSEKDLEGEVRSPNLGPVSDCYCPEIEPVPSQAQASETECSIAANILAGFRGHGDIQRARAELGCPDNARCSITNAALFNTLDSEQAIISYAIQMPW